MAYTLYYMFASMQGTLPWTVCKEEWKQFGCVEKTTRRMPYCDDAQNITQDCRCPSNATFDVSLPYNCTNVSYVGNPTPVAELYFYKEVIQRAPNIYPSDIGAPLWKLALCLLLSWIIVVVCLIKGIKSSGKVVYFTATFPYVILLILLVRGATLDGAIDGVLYFIVPKWEKLLDLKVWVAAAGQMFFSLSVSFGGIIMFGSFNKFKNNVYGDAMLIAVMDLITSIIAGFVIFTTFGGMAKELGVDVQDVAKGGYGMAFVAYPEALSNLPPQQLWSILFFFMLFTLGLDSEVCIRRFVNDVTYMLGSPPRPSWYWAFCWAFCAPVLIGLLFIYRMVKHSPPKVENDVVFPEFAQSIGWAITAFVMCPIPLMFLYKFLFQAKGNVWQRLKTITTPTSEWGPNDGSMKSELPMKDIANDSKYGYDNPVIHVADEENHAF
ncbi:hypothetical protein ACJMK2_007999 [Sinanodonta woodiana]|uniref:Uncharacterized protein n=1 Tax=Sinanodonta woodiana TaxID=1069815 RepID=A0ABD3VLT0_SINWO